MFHPATSSGRARSPRSCCRSNSRPGCRHPSRRACFRQMRARSRHARGSRLGPSPTHRSSGSDASLPTCCPGLRTAEPGRSSSTTRRQGRTVSSRTRPRRTCSSQRCCYRSGTQCSVQTHRPTTSCSRCRTRPVPSADRSFRRSRRPCRYRRPQHSRSRRCSPVAEVLSSTCWSRCRRSGTCCPCCLPGRRSSRSRSRRMAPRRSKSCPPEASTYS